MFVSLGTCMVHMHGDSGIQGEPHWKVVLWPPQRTSTEVQSGVHFAFLIRDFATKGDLHATNKWTHGWMKEEGWEKWKKDVVFVVLFSCPEYPIPFCAEQSSPPLEWQSAPPTLCHSAPSAKKGTMPFHTCIWTKRLNTDRGSGLTQTLTCLCIYADSKKDAVNNNTHSTDLGSSKTQSGEWAHMWKSVTETLWDYSMSL